uniref:Single domain-containing protein n=2 Tax=Bactrocera dorsalis TaxID=27457 RepID=A0A034WMR4_BACDO
MSALLVFIICATLPLTWTFSTQYYGNTKHTALPNHCYYEELKLAVPVNDTLYPTDIEFQCITVSCRHDYVLVIKHCDRYLLRHGCIEQPPDYSRPYPDCCTQIKCAD